MLGDSGEGAKTLRGAAEAAGGSCCWRCLRSAEPLGLLGIASREEDVGDQFDLRAIEIVAAFEDLARAGPIQAHRRCARWIGGKEGARRLVTHAIPDDFELRLV